ncbi:hypothetical protein GCM10027186_50090 [Micromonospora schwarzwaldensis]
MNRPADPHGCSSEEAASSATYSPTSSIPATCATGIAPNASARSVASQPASCAPLRPPSTRPNSTAPAAPGNVYAATANAVQVPR